MPPKRKDINFLFDDGEDTVAIIDDEANEDLRLKILEKAFSRRNVDNKLDSDLSFDPGVVSTVMVNGGKSKKVKNSKSNKKMKRNKLEAANEIVTHCVERQDEDNMVEDVVRGEEEDGETTSNSVMTKLLRGARYFDPLDAGWVTCYSCGEKDHITVSCPTLTNCRKSCFICASLEHGARQWTLMQTSESTKTRLKDSKAKLCGSGDDDEVTDLMLNPQHRGLENMIQGLFLARIRDYTKPKWFDSTNYLELARTMI
ncbi:putative transcription factor interactor and regulator CCHC(Zn) family [Arabidopsis thaliana]|uniref:Zinc finger CCHC-type superfamily n=1 Tax=Arabidopsis thaliana x Arabidopsis arenosa TaxID=1240361 RepID=A0A8T2EUT8_9BRAS|nr:Zinc finger CCHC-type superfamily [Arabidopsis thaliana x Arabidopsis arenosa]